MEKIIRPSRDTHVAHLPMGYEAGLPRSLGHITHTDRQTYNHHVTTTKTIKFRCQGNVGLTGIELITKKPNALCLESQSSMRLHPQINKKNKELVSHRVHACRKIGIQTRKRGSPA
jgi:hypothetical protein